MVVNIFGRETSVELDEEHGGDAGDREPLNPLAPADAGHAEADAPAAETP